MSRVYKLYLPTYLPTAPVRFRAGFSLNRRQRESHPIDRAIPHHPLAPRSSSLSLTVHLPPTVPLTRPSPPSQPRDTPPTPCTTLLERACGAPPRVSVRACLTIRVFVSAMNVLSPTVNRAARSTQANRKEEGKRRKVTGIERERKNGSSPKP